MERSDSLPSVPPRFVLPRLAVPPRAPPVRSRGAARSLPTGLGFGEPISPLPVACGNDRASQVPGEPPVPMPCSQTPVGPPRQATSALRCGLPPLLRRRLPRHASFGALSHGLVTRCLRFAAWVTPGQRKTRFQLLAKLCRAGLATRWVPIRGFRDAYISSSLSRLPLAHKNRERGNPWALRKAHLDARASEHTCV